MATDAPSARARGHGEFLRLWESSAPLNDAQLQLCSRVEAAVSATSSAPHTVDAPLDHTAAYQGVDGLKGLEAVSSAEEFHAWHDEMERRLSDAAEEKYTALLEGLEADRAGVARLLTAAEEAEKGLERVKEGRQFVAGVVNRFKEECEAMVSERKKMGDLAEALRKRLTYFEELETMTKRFGGGGISPIDPDFVKLLHRLDECIAYASSSTGAVAEADGYLTRFVELQRRAFVSVRDHTVQALRETAGRVAKELRDERASGAGFSHADLTDASKEYLRFRTIAPRVKSLMTELHSRAQTEGKTPRRDPYAALPTVSTRAAAMGLLADCEEAFFDQRKRLLEPSVAAHVKSIADVRNMIALARLGSAYVLRVCQLERQLYEHFFPVEGEESPVLIAALRGVCDVVYTELRPQILQENDLDKLVYLIEVLKTEILGDEVPRRGFAGKAFAPSAVRAIADAQERIIYRAEIFMRDEIRGFAPEPYHLDYPQCILRHQRGVASALRGHGKLVEEDEISPADGTQAKTKVRDEAEDVRSVGIYATWYPPVERTLRLLSMLYRCVEGEVFAGVAQEVVAICVQSVGSAAARIAATDKPNAEDHAQLFLVWQLLMTREQISPFDVEMSYTEHELDFLELRSLLGSVIRGQLSARSLANPPAVREKVMDSKRELDHRVRGACEAFILKTTRLLLDPALAFLAKSNALPASAPAHQRRQPAPGEVPATPPKAPFEALKANTGSFAHPKRLRETWEKVMNAVEKDLPPVVERMKIYIQKAASRAVLLRPIRANLAEAATELLSTLQLRYSLEEREAIGIDGEAVGKLLDKADKVMGIGIKT